MMLSAITLVEDAIHNPSELRHYMILEKIQHRVLAVSCSTQMAYAGYDRPAGIMLREVGKTIYEPIVYFPRETVDMSQLIRSEKTTRCPLKGQASYFHIKIHNKTLNNAAWSYEQVLSFDARLQQIKHFIAFDPQQVHTSLDHRGAK